MRPASVNPIVHLELHTGNLSRACDTECSLWLPYVEVSDVAGATERACMLGASVLLEPREGPVGWRSVVEVPAGAAIAMWQPKV